ncbi:indolepyruvate oxidoreductase subunit beta family protein [Sphingomonas adhaesiva]|uniref:indolepyruvate oxidoreductase subunit beta family protein n=1 Tax=Sphingomonas adhaesiva TaxID=28212 RepID=UPI002FF82D27
MQLTLPDRDRITIAILALGGEGGGVLAEWVQEVARAQGYIAQGTSVPGVAQRTGSTVYYIELVRAGGGGANRPDPVLAMMPVPGDVDIVIASELMEAGRAILRGFVSADRTTLIGSTHRVYAISEKSAPGDGTGASARILDAAERRAARFIGFDMAAAAQASGSVISSIMLGALAGSDALPFPHSAFEDAIRHGGKAVEANLKGFGLGFTRAQEGEAPATEAASPAGPTTAAGRALHKRLTASLPDAAHPLATEGVRRLMDYQDAAYAALYLDRLEEIAALDAEDGALTAAAARHLALWMAYEDTIRVADLKVRATRSARVAREIRLAPGQLLTVTEYMHPRLQEVCETMPRRIGAFVLASPRLTRWLAPLFRRGRHVRTTGLRWFIALRLLAALRQLRAGTLRYAEEQARIADWLALAREAARTDRAAAVEILACQSLIKGYSDTFERGLAHFAIVIAAARDALRHPDAASRIAALREAALADENGTALACAVAAA